MKNVTNGDRAEWAARALAEFAAITRIQDEAPSAQLHDLLCNLQHYSDAYGLDFDSVLAGARRTYAQEVQEAEA